MNMTIHRLVKRTNPDNSTIEYFYDWLEIATGVKTKGGATSHAYDDLND